MNRRLRPVSLRCEYRTEPLGIDSPRPKLSWIIHHYLPDQTEPGCPQPDFAVLREIHRGGCQLKYQILAASSREKLEQNQGDLWNSQEVSSAQMSNVPFGGASLSSVQQVWWKVRILNERGWSEWSDPTHFTMGLLKPEDWIARWIGAGPKTGESQSLPIFRRELSLKEMPTRALAFVCGLGHFELRVNGQKAGDNELDPGWTNYARTCLYVSHDVTSLLQAGPNVLAMILGNGMYNVMGKRYKKFKGSFGPPKLILQMHLSFADGSQQIVVSDEYWKVSPGPITFSCIYGGEDFDARQEQGGWDRAGFHDEHWANATISNGTGGELRAQSAPPLRIIRRLEPTSITRIAPDVALYDLGQNFSGWPAITARGESGAEITLMTGELLDSSGRVWQKSSGSPVSFGFKSVGIPRTWRPKFSFTGFRYIEARGDIGSIEKVFGEFVHASAAVAGKFSCSKPLFNQIHDLINAAILSNMHSVLTDCPHREKLGWLEQSHLMGPAIMFGFDVPLLYSKICADMREAQHQDGCVPTIAPEFTKFKEPWQDFSNSPEWGSAAVINPWIMYQQYGDIEFLRENYEMMRRYVQYLDGRAQGGIIDFGLGDWYDVGPGDPSYAKLTSNGLTATAIYYLDLQILQKASLLLGHTEEAHRLRNRADQVKQAFRRRFFNEETGQHDRASQTANAMPLALGLVDPADADRVLNNLVADIRSHDNHVTAGDIGFRFVIDALASAGRSDVIFDMLCRTDPPSYGAQLAAGATTLTEAWDANPKNSQNHLMLGHAQLWFYRDLAGIQIDLSRSSPHQIIIRPSIVGDIEWTYAEYDSILGRISSRWERKGKTLNVIIEIPFNCSATLYLPAPASGILNESGRPVATSRRVHLIDLSNGLAELVVDSGHYSFETELSKT